MPVSKHYDLSFQIAKKWERSVSNLREYQVIRDGNIFRTSLSESYIFHGEYERAQQLKDELLKKYEGMTVNAALQGKEVETPIGDSYLIQSSSCIDPPDTGCSNVDFRFLSDLKLIKGIGAITEKSLKGKGYTTIRDLFHHPKYRNYAAQFLSCLDSRDVYRIAEWISGRYPKSHSRVLETSWLIESENFVFFDIETLGIFSRPIILFGIGYMSRGKVHIMQYILRDVREEPAALVSALDHFEGDEKAIITFNGKSFDIPYLHERAAYYGMPLKLDKPHYDLLHFSRRKWRGVFSNYRLSSLEKGLFGIKRSNDIPSQLVPDFYETYLRTGNPGPLVPIVEHNRQDVVSLVHLYYHLINERTCP